MTGPATLVQLINGEFVLSDAEAFRHEAEARFVLNLDSLAERRNFLSVIEAKRGPAAADELRATMLKLHEAKNANPA